MSIRLTVLATLAAALIAAPVCYTLAQPTEPATPKPAPTDAPKPGQPGGEGRRGPGGPDGRGGGGAGRGGDASSLPQSIKQSMMIMNRALKTLSAQAADASKKDENLKHVSDMQRGCLAAKALTPDKAVGREPDAAKKTEMSTSYRKNMILMMEHLLKLETAILEGKGAEAEKLIAVIAGIRDQGHFEFNVRD